ncbi:hypothetical protein HDU97_005478 [Phlyctochytrium planicorne]|nr:hypothetical protein HDU97_005478 [Phlyctochytrium planicorne]
MKETAMQHLPPSVQDVAVALDNAKSELMGGTDATKQPPTPSPASTPLTTTTGRKFSMKRSFGMLLKRESSKSLKEAAAATATSTTTSSSPTAASTTPTSPVSPVSSISAVALTSPVVQTAAGTVATATTAVGATATAASKHVDAVATSTAFSVAKDSTLKRGESASKKEDAVAATAAVKKRPPMLDWGSVIGKNLRRKPSNAKKDESSTQNDEAIAVEHEVIVIAESYQANEPNARSRFDLRNVKAHDPSYASTYSASKRSGTPTSFNSLLDRYMDPTQQEIEAFLKKPEADADASAKVVENAAVSTEETTISTRNLKRPLNILAPDGSLATNSEKAGPKVHTAVTSPSWKPALWSPQPPTKITSAAVIESENDKNGTVKRRQSMFRLWKEDDGPAAASAPNLGEKDTTDSGIDATLVYAPPVSVKEDIKDDVETTAVEPAATEETVESEVTKETAVDPEAQEAPKALEEVVEASENALETEEVCAAPEDQTTEEKAGIQLTSEEDEDSIVAAVLAVESRDEEVVLIKMPEMETRDLSLRQEMELKEAMEVAERLNKLLGAGGDLDDIAPAVVVPGDVPLPVSRAPVEAKDEGEKTEGSNSNDAQAEAVDVTESTDDFVSASAEDPEVLVLASQKGEEGEEAEGLDSAEMAEVVEKADDENKENVEGETTRALAVEPVVEAVEAQKGKEVVEVKVEEETPATLKRTEKVKFEPEVQIVEEQRRNRPNILERILTIGKKKSASSLKEPVSSVGDPTTKVAGTRRLGGSAKEGRPNSLVWGRPVSVVHVHSIPDVVPPAAELDNAVVVSKDDADIESAKPAAPLGMRKRSLSLPALIRRRSLASVDANNEDGKGVAEGAEGEKPRSNLFTKKAEERKRPTAGGVGASTNWLRSRTVHHTRSGVAVSNVGKSADAAAIQTVAESEVNELTALDSQQRESEKVESEKAAAESKGAEDGAVAAAAAAEESEPAEETAVEAAEPEPVVDPETAKLQRMNRMFPVSVDSDDHAFDHLIKSLSEKFAGSLTVPKPTPEISDDVAEMILEVEQIAAVEESEREGAEGVWEQDDQLSEMKDLYRKLILP